MIRFGLRLAVRGGREAVTRLVLIAVAVAIGTGLLLSTLAGINAVNTQNARYAWLETGSANTRAGRPGVDPAWWQLSADRFQGTVIGRIDVAATGPHSPVPPGIAALPGPGQFYVSPELSKLLASTPRDELGARYPGNQIGTIGDAALPAPNSLVIVIGHTPAQLANVPGAEKVTSISTVTPSSCNGPSDCSIGVGIDANGIDLILSVVAAALLFPVLTFIATATRLSAARREQRFAAMRLVGATPRQITVISAVESTLAAAVGVLAGFGVFFALRPALAPIPFAGAPFFISDLSLNLLDVLLVLIGVPVGAAVAAQLALRRVSISPLGVYRRVTPAPPTAWRLLPLALGLGELAYFAVAGRPATTGGQILAFLPGILVTMAGLVIAGPWLTMVGSRLMARRARRPAPLIAARRLADNPQTGFRAISGLVLALFVTTTAIGVITTIDAYDGGAHSTAGQRSTLINDFSRDVPGGAPTDTVPSVPGEVLAQLRAIPGVDAVVLTYQNPNTARFQWRGVMSCADLGRVPALGRCPAGAQTVTVEPDAVGAKFAPDVWPAATMTADQITSQPVRDIVVAANSAVAVERARTVLDNAYPQTASAITVTEQRAQGDAQNTQYRQLANVVIIASLPIAGCTLAVSVVAGLNERKRPFSLLRLTGAPLRMLRRVVVLESAVPLLVAAAVSIGAGFLAAYLFLRSQLSEQLQSPGVAFYGLVAAGVLVSLAIIASTLPVLRRISGPESARNE